MTLDGITLGAIVAELQGSIVGAKIEKIQQPRAGEVVLVLHTSGGKKRLLLSAQGSDARVHLTEEARPAPAKAPNFCMLLRKYIGSGRIAGIDQMGLERIVRIEIDARDELGVSARYTLLIEIMGKYSNLMLLAPGEKILDSIHHVSLDMSRVRQVLPGMTYAPPEMNKLSPADEERAAAALLGKTPPGCLVEVLQGFSRQAAAEVCARHFGDEPPAALSGDDARALAAAARRFVEESLAAPCPSLQVNADGTPVFYSPTAYITYSPAHRMRFASANALVDGYYIHRTRAAELERRRTALGKVLRRHIARVEKKEQYQLETLAAADKADTFRLYGELLTANIYQVRRGMREVTLTNYYTGANVTIPLDVKLSPSANATQYFKKVGKLKNGAVIAAQKSREYADELAFLEQLEYNLSAAADLDELAEVRAELIKYGYLEAAPREKPHRSDPLEHPHRFRTSDGLLVLAGRNSRQNDALTLRVAGPKDIWLHSKNIPGAHVVLFTGGAEPGEQALFEAATIAATLCRASAAPKVDIDYAPRSHVWKPGGARPGMVLYEGYSTLTVAPDPARVEALREADAPQK